MSVIQVVLADDHPQVRRGLRSLLQQAPGIEVVGEASNGAEALELARELTPDVLVLDMEMPVVRGIEVAQTLQDEGNPLSVLALSAYEDRQFIMGMLENGAAGYLVKDEVPEMLVRAIKGVAQGENGWVSRRVAARIALWLAQEQPGEIDITPRDIQVLRLFLTGYMLPEIADRTDQSEVQVEHTLDRVVSQIRDYGKTLHDRSGGE